MTIVTEQGKVIGEAESMAEAITMLSAAAEGSYEVEAEDAIYLVVKQGVSCRTVDAWSK